MTTIHFLLYPKIQPMDLIGPWEVCATWQSIPGVDVQLEMVAETQDPVSCLNGITLNPTQTFSSAEKADYCFIPGGFGRMEQMQHQPCLNFIRQQAQDCRLLLSICTGAFLLAEAGLLDHHKTTTYWRALPEFRERYPDLEIEERRIVKSGDIWSAGGISSGIDLAFALIEHAAGIDQAGVVQLMFEYFPLDDHYAKADTLTHVPPYPTRPKNTADPLPAYIKSILGA